MADTFALILSSCDTRDDIRFFYDQVRVRSLLVERGIPDMNVQGFFNGGISERKLVDEIGDFDRDPAIRIPGLSADSARSCFAGLRSADKHAEREFLNHLGRYATVPPPAMRQLLVVMLNHGDEEGVFGRSLAPISGPVLAEALSQISVPVCVVLVACYAKTIAAHILELEKKDFVVFYDQSLPGGVSLNWQILPSDEMFLTGGSFLVHFLWLYAEYDDFVERLLAVKDQAITIQGLRHEDRFRLRVVGQLDLLRQRPFFGMRPARHQDALLPRFRAFKQNPATSEFPMSAELLGVLQEFARASHVDFQELIGLAQDYETENTAIDACRDGLQRVKSVARVLKERHLIDIRNTGGCLAHAMVVRDLDAPFVDFLRSQPPAE